MQRQIVQTGKYLGKEAAKLPNADTPNYKVAAAATAFLAFDTIVSSLNCGSFSFWLNAGATLLSAGVTYNQYSEGAPLNAAKAMYARFFGGEQAAPAANPPAAASAHEEEHAVSPSM